MCVCAHAHAHVCMRMCTRMCVYVRACVCVYHIASNYHRSHKCRVLFSGPGEKSWKEINSQAVIRGNTVYILFIYCAHSLSGILIISASLLAAFVPRANITRLTTPHTMPHTSQFTKPS